MDANTRKLAGWVIAAIGAVIALVALLADQVGLGGDGEAEALGSKQIIMLVVGLVILAGGAAFALISGGAAGAKSD